MNCCLVNSREVPVGEDTGEEEVVGVVCLAVKVQEVGHVDIIQTERILWLHKTVGVIEDFDPVGLEGVAGHLFLAHLASATDRFCFSQTEQQLTTLI